MNLKAINIPERMSHHKVAGLSMAFVRNRVIHSTETYGVLEYGTDRDVLPNSIFNACSISKFTTAMLVLKLVDQGMVSLDRDVNDYLKTWQLPTNQYNRHEKVTLRSLLCHQSGMTDPEGSFENLSAEQGPKPTILEVLTGQTSYCNEPIKVTSKPFSAFHYSDAGFCCIEQILEDLAGKPFTQLMEEFIFEPLQMKNSLYISRLIDNRQTNLACGHHKKGELVNDLYTIYPYAAASGLWSTPIDLATLLIEGMNSLHNEGKLGLPMTLLTEMLSPQGCAPWTGLGVFLEQSDNLQISSLGWGIGYQSLLLANPYQGTGIVMMMNTDLGVHQLEGLMGEILQAIKAD
ncbi:serine hydrolase domain-containing protein [Guptibacillus hwajinpoensis]|uniref:serine hydrolase domain-containing protein n=1 Tax=Guptibacillus hwajinpoensis TaxID=208199 RepID=UPI0037359AB2